MEMSGQKLFQWLRSYSGTASDINPDEVKFILTSDPERQATGDDGAAVSGEAEAEE